MAAPAPRLLPFWQRSHDMNDLCDKPRIATWGFSKSGRKMRPDIVHNSKSLPRQGRGHPCCPRARGAVFPERTGFLLFRLRLCSKGGVRMIDSKRTRFSRRVLNGRQRPYGKRGDSHTSDVHGSHSQHHFRTSRSIAISGSFFILRASTLRSGAMMIFPRDCFMRAIIWLLEVASLLKEGR